jgi:uncharacterized membrane protein
MLHLFHPALVHFSVAFLIVGGCAEIFGALAGRDATRRWGATLVLVGLVSLVPTIASWHLAANTLAIPQASHSLLEAHERTGWILLGLLLAAQFWKAWCGGRVPDRLRWIYLTVLAAAVLLVAYGAWLGGRMVFDRGIGVS